MKRWQPSIMILLAMFLTQTAQAHTFGAHDAGFAAGLAHPFIGLDHLLAMVAVGMWHHARSRYIGEPGAVDGRRYRGGWSGSLGWRLRNHRERYGRRDGR
ncbi:MAG: HupE/UreJ family protein [Gammaproteobacteria bacterium]|nr:HupE/UreJ family protein [Gammaproteobacteria bacterium]